MIAFPDRWERQRSEREVKEGELKIFKVFSANSGSFGMALIEVSRYSWGWTQQSLWVLSNLGYFMIPCCQLEDTWRLWMVLFGCKHEFRGIAPLCKLNCFLLIWYKYQQKCECDVWRPRTAAGCSFTLHPALSSSLQIFSAFFLTQKCEEKIMGHGNEAGNRTF